MNWIAYVAACIGATLIGATVGTLVAYLTHREPKSPDGDE